MTLEANLSNRGGVLTRRELLVAAERTVGEAKWQRDCVVRFTGALQADETLTLRSDCAACRCKFQVNVKRSSLAELAKWCCPNCGTPQERPPVPAVDSPVGPVTI
jgi:hypothetical protein